MAVDTGGLLAVWREPQARTCQCAGCLSMCKANVTTDSGLGNSPESWIPSSLGLFISKE